ncbi:hypothetical protein FHK02_3990 [Spirosoma sp. LMG 31448]|nr:hypothetical protein [Spirosoma utsteinense]
MFIAFNLFLISLLVDSWEPVENYWQEGVGCSLDGHVRVGKRIPSSLPLRVYHIQLRH